VEQLLAIGGHQIISIAVAAVLRMEHQPFRETPRNRLGRPAGVAPGEGVGAATRSARSLAQSVDGACISLALAAPIGRRRLTYLKVPVAWAHTRSCASRILASTNAMVAVRCSSV